MSACKESLAKHESLLEILTRIPGEGKASHWERLPIGFLFSSFVLEFFVLKENDFQIVASESSRKPQSSVPLERLAWTGSWGTKDWIIPPRCPPRPNPLGLFVILQREGILQMRLS